MNEVTDALTGRIIACAIQVHCELGPGYLESVYEEALAIALRDAGLRFKRQLTVDIYFRGNLVGIHRLDFLIEDEVVSELKAVSEFENVHFAILRSYLKATSKRRGLLMNFATPILEVKRVGREFRPRTRSARC
jgi:GxxExxY protein